MSCRGLELSDVTRLRSRWGLPVQIDSVLTTQAEAVNAFQAPSGNLIEIDPVPTTQAGTVNSSQALSENLIELVSRELAFHFTPFLSFQEIVTISRISKKMPSALNLVKIAHISKPARLFTASSKELLFLVENGGLPLFIKCLESYFKNIKKQELKEAILISRYDEAIRKGNFAIAYALHIFAGQNELNLAISKKTLQEIQSSKNKYAFNLQRFFALTKCRKTATLVNERCIALHDALHKGDIQKAEKELAFVRMIKHDEARFPPWEDSWKWVFGAIRGLTYEKTSRLEKALVFVIDHSIEEVNPFQAVLTGWTRIVSKGSLYVDQPKWVLDFFREKQLLTEEEIGEAITHTIIYWLQHGNRWYYTDQIAQKVFSFAREHSIDLSQLGELIGRNMWSRQHYSTCTAFVQKNQLQIPHYWHHAAIQLIPYFKYFFDPAQKPLFNYKDY